MKTKTILVKARVKIAGSAATKLVLDVVPEAFLDVVPDEDRDMGLPVEIAEAVAAMVVVPRRISKRLVAGPASSTRVHKKVVALASEKVARTLEADGGNTTASESP